MSVGLFAGLRFVVEDVKSAISDLQEVNVAGDHLRVEVEIKPMMAAVRQVRSREVYGYFNRNGYGVIYEHETLQCFMPLMVIEGCGQDQRGHARSVVLFALDTWGKFGWKFGRGMFDLGEEVVWKASLDLMEIITERSEGAVVGISEKEVRAWRGGVGSGTPGGVQVRARG